MDLKSIAVDVSNGKYKNIVFMVGAGISTSAGIPDFRSPETGLYANLAKMNLPYPEAVFAIDYLRKNPRAFYSLAEELYPGKFQPTLFHKFMHLVHQKGYLKRIYTQNIDTLERLAGIPGEKMVEAHGSFAGNHCIDCKCEMSSEMLRDAMDKGEVPHCAKCGGIVKPDIVFFGEALPSRFFEMMSEDLPDNVDLVIVAGTSLQVSPFNMLPESVYESCPRILFNMDLVGDFGSRKNDVIVLGNCDDNIEYFAQLLRWDEDLGRTAAAAKGGIDSAVWLLHEVIGEIVEEMLDEIPQDVNSDRDVFRAKKREKRHKRATRVRPSNHKNESEATKS